MNRFCRIFSQVLQLFSHSEFEAAVRKHKAERHARGFTCWGQFVAMLFCQLGRAQSLREICGGLAAAEGKLKHLGLSAGPARATLSYDDHFLFTIRELKDEVSRHPPGTTIRVRYRRYSTIGEATLVVGQVD